LSPDIRQILGGRKVRIALFDRLGQWQIAPGAGKKREGA
jgi:hypothetical protein